MFAFQITRLSCNYEHNPISIDDLHPRLSGQIVSPHRGMMQSAYRIIVSSSIKNLVLNIENSKKTHTDQSLYIPYAGKALLSGRVYYWKVRIWAKRGKVGEWSDVATWRMGLLHQEDWKGQWITASKWFTPPVFRPKGFQLSAKGGWADVDLGKSTAVELVKLFPLDSASFPLRFQILGSDEFNFVHHKVLADQSSCDFRVKTPGTQIFRINHAKCRYIRLQILSNNENKNTTVTESFVRSGYAYTS